MSMMAGLLPSKFEYLLSILLFILVRYVSESIDIALTFFSYGTVLVE